MKGHTREETETEPSICRESFDFGKELELDPADSRCLMTGLHSAAKVLCRKILLATVEF